MRSRASVPKGSGFTATFGKVSAFDRQVCLLIDRQFFSHLENLVPQHTQRRSLFRELNERIRGISVGFAVTDESYDVFCECGRLDCDERVEVPTEIYERARGDGRLYVVRPGHEPAYADRVLAADAAYSVVVAN